ncbi:hypothetical protein HPP92_009384 [Vanilla planifolia]|uniref:Uncharacterized protein n=1 Tax=Vanilla planifolia TaxID=51239 RepID=A0A835V696_VANPL|nr:hypothetical protein HPP92_009384 [Vanilla planifolia]
MPAMIEKYTSLFEEVTSIVAGYYINCGSPKEEDIDGIKWIPDEGFINGGNVSKINTPGIIPLLSTLRYFPDKIARKNCFVIQVSKGHKYMIRTTYYYGGFDGGKEPTLFDQIIDGTRWSTVDTSQNYAAGLTSYYEIIIAARGKTLSVCAWQEMQTLQLVQALSYLPLKCYPDDPFNRYWQSFIDSNPVVDCHSNVSSPDFWNYPPPAALMKALTTSRGKQLIVDWPPFALPSTSYYLALYFQDNRTPSPFSWRVFNIAVNEEVFYQGLNVSTKGVMVYGSLWPLSGKTKISLTPMDGSPVGPIINAGEIFQIVPLSGRTLTRDVIAMEDIARSFNNPPSDWKGDPCMPEENSWTGVSCNINGSFARVTQLDLTNFEISGTLSDSIENLTAISKIWLSGNKLSGTIPQMTNLKELVSLHLADNEFTGQIPSSLGNLPKIKEIFLQNNKLSGPIPDNLKNRSGVDLKISKRN